MIMIVTMVMKENVINFVFCPWQLPRCFDSITPFGLVFF